MTATQAEHVSVPFHLGLTEPIDGTTITDRPGIEGAYDPIEQIWKLPDGTPLTDSRAIENSWVRTETYSVVDGIISTDDVHLDAGTA